MDDQVLAGTHIRSLDQAESMAFFLANGIDPPAPVFVVVLDANDCTTGDVIVLDEDRALFPLLEVGSQAESLRVIVVSDLDAGSRCDPDDVLEWEEAVDVLAAGGGQLVEWLVLSGCDVRSKSRYAPTPGLAHN